jgi:hypothetical protein
MTEPTLETIRRRAADFNYVLYLQVASLLASATLALAAVVLVQIIEAADDTVLRLTLWLATVLAVFSIFARAVHDNMFQTARVRLGVWYYLLMGLAQLIMFATLQPQDRIPNSWHWWFPAAVAYMIATAFLVRHIARTVKPSDFPRELAAFASAFIARTRVHDLRLIASNIVVLLVATVLVFLAPDDAALLKLAVTAFGALISALNAILLYQDFVLFEKGWSALEEAGKQRPLLNPSSTP